MISAGIGNSTHRLCKVVNSGEDSGMENDHDSGGDTYRDGSARNVSDKHEADEATNEQDTEKAFSHPVKNNGGIDDDARAASKRHVQRHTHRAGKLEERASSPDVSSSIKMNTKSSGSPPGVEHSEATPTPPSFHHTRSTRRMAAYASPVKSMTTRNLLGPIGMGDSLVSLQQTEEELRKVVTDEAIDHMRGRLQSGVDVYRLVREKWKKEVLRVQDGQIVLTRKKAITLLSKQLKFPWTAVHAFQHELQPTDQVLQLLAPPGKRMTSILLVALRGETVEPTEFTLKSPKENAIGVACLQEYLQEKRKAGLIS